VVVAVEIPEGPRLLYVLVQQLDLARGSLASSSRGSLRPHRPYLT
jgi:hypothetical protein